MTIEKINERIESIKTKINKANALIDKKCILMNKKKTELSSKFNFNFNEGDVRSNCNTLESMGYSKEDAWTIYWLECDVDACLNSINDKYKEIKSLEDSLARYEEMLKEESAKANSRDIPVILEFVNQWQQDAREWYMKGLVPCYEELENVRKLGRKTQELAYGTNEWKLAQDEYTSSHKQYIINCKGEYREVTPEERQLSKYRYTSKVKVSEGKYEKYGQYIMYDSLAEAVARLDRDLEVEKNRKYDDLVNRVCKVVGTITDVSGLRINEKLNLDGIVIGTNGRCKVETIGAGGWNIQCFHYRTLVNRI